MGYYNKYGYVGEYKGTEVYVVDKSEYTKDKINSQYIYAIRRKNREELDLVFQGYCIGIMWDDGRILNKAKTPWVFEEPKKKKKVEVKVEKKEPSVDIDNYDFSVDFSEYEAVVNDVFKNLNKWWEDLEKEGT